MFMIFTLLFAERLAPHTKNVLDFASYVSGALSLSIGLVEQAKNYPALAHRFHRCGLAVNSVRRRGERLDGLALGVVGARQRARIARNAAVLPRAQRPLLQGVRETPGLIQAVVATGAGHRLPTHLRAAAAEALAIREAHRGRNRGAHARIGQPHACAETSGHWENRPLDRPDRSGHP